MLAANEAYAHDFRLAGLEPVAARGLAVLTCIDSRIEPLDMLGLRPGDAKILRNAGARVTDDVLRTLVLASYLLGVDRAMVVAHTKCRMGSGDEDDIHAALDEAGGPDTRSLAFLVTDDQEATVREDVQRVAHGRTSRVLRSAASSTTSIPDGSPSSADQPVMVRLSMSFGYEGEDVDSVGGYNDGVGVAEAADLVE